MHLTPRSAERRPVLFALAPLLLLLVFCTSSNHAHAASCVSAGTGNWSTITWTNCPSGPTSADTVTISSGKTVHLNVDATVVSITITGTLDSSGAHTLSLAGTSGTLFTRTGTFTPSTNITLKVISASGSPTVFSSANTNLYNLTIDSTATVINMGAVAQTFASGATFYIKNGVFNASGAAMTGPGASGTFQIDAGAAFCLGGTTTATNATCDSGASDGNESMPTFATYTFDPTSTVYYLSDAATTVSSLGGQAYGNLQITPRITGNRNYTLGTTNVALVINGNFTINPNNTGAARTVTAIGNADVTVASGKTTTVKCQVAAAGAALNTSGNTFTTERIILDNTNGCGATISNNSAGTIVLTGTSGTLITQTNSPTWTPSTGTVKVTSASGSPQLVNAPTTFWALTIDAPNATKITAGAGITMSGNSSSVLYIKNGVFDDGGNTITGASAAKLRIDSGGTLSIGSAAAASTFPTTFNASNITLNSGSTVVYQAGVNQTISATPTYDNLTITPLSDTPFYAIDEATVINGNLTVNAGTLVTQGFQITAGQSGKTFTLANNAKFCLSGGSATNCSSSSTTAVTMPVFTNYSFDAGSSVVYLGNVNMTVSRLGGAHYGYLRLKPALTTLSATRTYTVETGTLAVDSDFEISPTSASNTADVLAVNMGGDLTQIASSTLKVDVDSATNNPSATLSTTGTNYAITTGFIKIGTNNLSAAKKELVANGSIISLIGTSGTLISTGSSNALFTQGTSEVRVNSASGNVTLNSRTLSFHKLTINPTSSSQQIGLGAAVTMSGVSTANKLYIQNGILSDNGYQIGGTSNAATTGLQIDATGQLWIGSGTTATTFPSLYTNGQISLATGSTVVYKAQGAISQTVSAVPTYSNLSVSGVTGGGTYTASGALTVNGTLDLNVTNGATFVLGGTTTLNGPLSLTHVSMTVGARTLNINGSSVTVASGGVINASNGSAAVVFGGTANLTLPSSLWSGTVTAATNNITGSSVTSGLSVPDGTFTTFTQGTNATTSFSGTVPTITTLTASASGNTVAYSAAGAQNIIPLTYYHLSISGSGNKNQTGAVTVNGNLVVLGAQYNPVDQNLTVNGSLRVVGGTFVDSNASGTDLFAGAVTVNSGTWDLSSGGSNVTFQNGLTVNSAATFTAGAGTYTFNTNAQTLGGTKTFSIGTIQNNVTSGNGLSISTSNLTVTTFTQGSGAVLTLTTATPPTITTLDATTNANTVQYLSSSAQTAVSANYSTLLNNNTNSSGLALSGSVTIAALTQGSNAVLTFNGTIPTVMTLDASASGNTVQYTGTSAQTVIATSYVNLKVGAASDSSAVRYPLGGDTTVSGTLTVGNNSSSAVDTLDDAGNTLTLSGSGTPLVVTTYGNFASSGIAPGAQPWYNASWTRRIKITVNHNMVSNSDQVNFPVYVNLAHLPKSFFSLVRSNGGDIRVTDSDGVTEIPRDMVSVDTSAQTGELWFKASRLSSEVNRDYYIYYGNAGASDYAASATYGANNVWDSSYKGVWHLGNTYNDSTTNAKNGTASGSGISSTAGTLGSATSFTHSGSDMVSTSLTEDSKSFTWSAWVKFNAGAPTCGCDMNIMSIGGSNYQLFDFGGNGTTCLGNIWAVDALVSDPLGATGLTTGTWYYLTYVRAGDNASSGYKMYLNGSLVGSAASNSWATGGQGIVIGGRADFNQSFWGLLDQAEVSDGARSADWIKTEYNNQSSPQTFYMVGPPEGSAQTGTVNYSNGGTVTIANGTYSNLTVAGSVSGATTATVNGLLNLTGAFSPASGVITTKDLTIGGTGSLTANSTTLKVTGNWTNNGTFTASGGTVTFASTTLSTIGGSSVTTFNNLTSTEAGKTFLFTQGGEVDVTGTWTLTGTVANPINLSSTVNGTQWLLKLTGSTVFSNVAVRDGGCAVGTSQVTLGTGAVNVSNNDSTCWPFAVLVHNGGGVTRAPGDGSPSNAPTSGGTNQGNGGVNPGGGVTPPDQNGGGSPTSGGTGQGTGGTPPPP